MFLIRKFQQFHAELVRLKARVAAGAWVYEGEPGGGLAESGAKESPTAVRQRLVAVLERQSLDAGRQGDFALELYREALYAMAALADEVFLNIDWIGKEGWRDHLIEAHFFKTQRAGEALFERIEKLLKERDPLFSELGRIYLLVLGLGFEGRYRGRQEAAETIGAYRKRLYSFVFNHDPLAVFGNEEVVPQAYSATLADSPTTELPYLRPWVWASVLAIVVWIGGTAGVWWYWTSRLTPVLALISSIEKGKKQQEAREGAGVAAPEATETTATTATTSTQEPRR